MKKDIVRAASVNDAICMNDLQRVLANIGVNEHRLSSTEIKFIFDEFGRDGVIDAPRFIKLI
jgi:hypothetical protein